MTPHQPVRLTVHSVFIYQDTGPKWAPDDPTHFYAAGMVFAGTEPNDGRADAFDFELCTPSWLAEHFDDQVAPTPQLVQAQRPALTPPTRNRVGKWWFGERRVLFGRGLILVRRWDRHLIERAIAEAFASVAAPTWPLAADRAGRLLPWEFDDRHDEQVDHHYPDP